MRVVLQRVLWARVFAEGVRTGEIGPGFCLLVGITHGDGPKEVEWMAEKVVHLRVFEDQEGKLNRSLLDVGGSVLAVSQFTLYGDCRRGRRPSFTEAARPEEASGVYEAFVEALRSKGPEVQTGVFQALMRVELANDGPVTLILESERSA